MSARFVKLTVLSLVALAIAWPGTARAQQGVQIVFDSLKIRDEDDPSSDDEPYLIVTRFQFRWRLDRGNPSIVPNTLKVAPVMGGHNNLGRRRDNWADEPHTYPIPNGIPRVAQNLLPQGQDNWILGAVVVFMEEDGFTAITARDLSARVHRAVERTLRAMTFSAADGRAVAHAVERKITLELVQSLGRLDLRGIIRGLRSAADPDDFGGLKVIVVRSAQGNQANVYSGQPDLASALMESRSFTGSTRVSLNFPARNMGRVPGNARYQGNCVVNATVRVWRQSSLF
jgi:hypothetical protein